MKYKLFNDYIQIENVFNSIDDFCDAFNISKHNKNKMIQSKKIVIEDNLITIHLEKEEIDYIPSNKDIKVIYEDDLILIVHKDHGYIIHDKDDNNCLNSRVAKYYEDNNISSFIRPIHRLDKDTTGLVIYSKISFFQSLLDQQIANKDIKRFYLAIVKGSCRINHSFIINSKIGRNRHKSGSYIISKSGKEAITKVTCINSKNGYSLFECELETGRTHQIRVHLASKNYPIINDPLYGIKDDIISYMGLWAYKVIIPHPITKEIIVVEDELRKDFHI